MYEDEHVERGLAPQDLTENGSGCDGIRPAGSECRVQAALNQQLKRLGSSIGTWPQRSPDATPAARVGAAQQAPGGGSATGTAASLPQGRRRTHRSFKSYDGGPADLTPP